MEQLVSFLASILSRFYRDSIVHVDTCDVTIAAIQEPITRMGSCTCIATCAYFVLQAFEQLKQNLLHSSKLTSSDLQVQGKWNNDSSGSQKVRNILIPF